MLSGEFEGNKFHHPSSKVWLVPSLKLTQQLKRGHPKRKFIFPPLIFRVANRKLTTCRIIHHPCVIQKGPPRISQGFFRLNQSRSLQSFSTKQLRKSQEITKKDPPILVKIIWIHTKFPNKTLNLTKWSQFFFEKNINLEVLTFSWRRC